jgi:hypothetical protein
MQIVVAPDSRTKSPQELIRESNFVTTPNVRLFFSLDLGICDQIYTISYYLPLLQIDGNKSFLPLC